MRSLLAVAVLASFVAYIHGGEQENPFKKANNGDWVEYKMVGPKMEGKTKMTIVAKTDNEVTYEIISNLSVNGQEIKAPVQKQTVDFTKPYDAISAANVKAKGVNIEKQGEGKAKIKVGDKEFDTQWTQMKATTTVNNMSIVNEFKMWFAKNVPLSGLVKLETSTSGFATTLELVGSGRK